MTNPAVLTKPRASDQARSTAPQPTTNSERYLFALLDSQAALSIALAALTARMAYADSYETDDIRLIKDEINLEYYKLESLKTAYLSRGRVYKAFTDAEVQRIRVIMGELQGFTAKKDRASAIVDAVTKLLENWEQVPPPAVAEEKDPIATLGDVVED